MNLSRLRVAWNVALVRLGVRKVLPREAVNRVPVVECGEPLVPWGEGMVREGVAKRLDEASRHLPEGYSLELMEGWRSPEEQERLREQTRAEKRAAGLDGDELARAVARWVANDSGHRTGGAVDVRLAFRGREAFCGSAWKEFGAGTASDARVGAEAARNRAILHRAMRAAGFANYPAEWWHFAFGDRLWAAYRGKRRAVYGPVGMPGSGEGMSLQFLKAGTADAATLAGISKQAFDSDVEVGGTCAGGPPGYDSLSFHAKMAGMNCLYKLVDADGATVGGALLFMKDGEMNVGRIFVSPEHFRKGYGICMMQQIEAEFPEVRTFTLDTPVWNVRTNAFYRKLGYTEVRRDGEFVYYEKRREG